MQGKLRLTRKNAHGISPPPPSKQSPRGLSCWWLLSLALLTLGYSGQVFASGNCENPNLLVILDRSCSMGFTGSSYVKSRKTCSKKSNCSPMNRTNQPSPGQTPRYSYTCSSSKCNYTRWDVATNAIKEIVYKYGGTAPAYSNRTVRFGLEYFSSSGVISRGITSNPPTIASSLSSTTASGGTQYINAFTTARTHLLSVVNADSVKRRPTHILFITDGDPGDSCATARSIVADLQNGTGTYRLQDSSGNIYKVKTYVIGFGSGLSSSGQACLNSIAAAGGTQRCNPSVAGCFAYFAADNDVELSNAMSSIINNATQEVCDGLDNDCDGQTDEALSRGCTTACGSGTQSCTNGNWNTCSSGNPSAEKCNNKDDDCDGQIDENFGNKGKSCAAGQGACRRSGTYVCNSAQTGTRCSVNAATPTAERCDGIDNDCDGRIDENFGNKGQSCTAGQGPCRRTGTYICNTAKTGTTCSATAGNPSAEKCDAKDNDCDGRVDENWPQKGSGCSVGKGLCKRSGTWICASNGSGVVCSAKAGAPAAEICDGKDNDCDGQTDEGCQCINNQTRTCFSGNTGCTKTGSSYNCKAPCKSGIQTCVTGRWKACVGEITPQAEVCDGKDNDCDGQVDENWTNKGRTCTVGVGSCKNSGKWRCKSNRSGLECSAQPKPKKAETCNNQDDDCDGQIDESLTQNCSTPCESGTETCRKGSWINCSARKPSKEICDGKDNDCDGQIDENFANKNKTCNVGVGVCKNSGKWQCKSDKTGLECSAQPKPSSKEVCDGKDNDCDGQTDENFAKKGSTCTNGLGECEKTGQFICKQDGTGLICSVPGGTPSPEVCDSKDNDCDGKIDEDIKKPCKSACGSGVQFCKNGSWEACNAPKPKTEICDNKDNDCDGQVDDKLEQKCTTICGEGKETCVAGKWVFCDAQKPKDEICDGKDNDCNGQIDDLPSKKCSGACGSGTATCQNGQWTGCSGPQPSAEVCDGKDNDCDGSIDNGIWKDCKGICGSGRQLCHNGTWGECNAPPPQPEACNGKDDDCDGVADNKAKCPAGTTCTEGKCQLKCRNGECPGGSVCSEGFCEGDLCKRIKCPSGKQCISGKCVAPCDLVTCPGKYVCDKGKCIKDDCYRNGCPSKQRCVRGICEANPCQDVSCASDQFCRDGKCIDTCSEVECKSDEKCVDGKCRPDPKKSGPCANIQCKSDEVCEKGKCVSDPCRSVTCPNGQKCTQGVCDHDPCLNIECPRGQKCEEGQCIKNDHPEEPNHHEGGMTTDGGTLTDKGTGPQNDRGNTSNDSQSGVDQITHDNLAPGTENGGTTDNQNTTDQSLGGKGKNKDGAGGRYVAPGCQCNSISNGPMTPLMLFFAFIIALGSRRKRSHR